MSPAPDNRSAGDEIKWRAWVEKGKQRDRAAAGKYRWAGVLFAALLTLAAIYFAGVR